MTYFSHSKTDAAGERYGSKPLRVHVAGVFDKATSALFPGHAFPEANDLRELVERVCLFHDLGKYTPHFQNYLLNKPPFEERLKQHAKFGAYALYEWYRSEGREWLGLLGCYLVVHHHKSLSELASFKKLVSPDEANEEIFCLQLESLTHELSAALHDSSLVHCQEFIRFPEKKPFQRLISRYVENNDEQQVKWYYFLNYAFSLLIEADKHDASDTAPYQRVALPTKAVEMRLGVATWDASTDLSKFSQNELRAWVRGRVLSQLDDPDILKKRLFTLTAPTGIGKTLTALDFALRLREAVHADQGYWPQIIYGLPFINIIEQAIAEYECTLGNQGRLLAHYQYTDALEQLKETKLSDGREENEAYNQKRMLVDTWQGDVVITSFVQLLQTLIGNRNKLLLKFNHFAGAIIILDEVQTIRLGQLPLVGAALVYLAKYLNARVLLMTATKPLTFELAHRVILKPEGEKTPDVQELLPEYAQVFATFHRTKLVPLLASPLTGEDDFLANALIPNWKPTSSCLIVCNLVRRSIRLFETIQQHQKQEELDNPLYYLSTNVVPVERLRIIQQIKADLLAGLKPILIATQVVEAGVDLDFDMGYRDLGPVDSIVQVAGRINRENDSERSNSPLFVVDFGDCGKIYDPITTEQTRNAIALQSNNFKRAIPESEYLELVSRYFGTTASQNKFEEAKLIFAGMKILNYDNREADTKPVSSFRIIDDKGFAESVFIELDDQAGVVRKQFKKLINKEIGPEEFEPFKKDFNQRIITIPSYLPRFQELKQSLKNRLCEGIYIVNRHELNDYYNFHTGFRRENESGPVAIAL